MGLTDRVASIIGFLRAGYPTVAPAMGYVPLLALLPRRIGEDEITRITGKLIRLRRGPIDNVEVDNVEVDNVEVDNVEVDNVDIAVEITHVTDEMPSLDDIERVQHRVASIGRPTGQHG